LNGFDDGTTPSLAYVLLVSTLAGTPDVGSPPSRAPRPS
jgi:hypothetical protein